MRCNILNKWQQKKKKTTDDRRHEAAADQIERNWLADYFMIASYISGDLKAIFSGKSAEWLHNVNIIMT